MPTLSSLPPKADRYFEDYQPGHTYALGEVVVNEQEVIDFAARFDPQYFHLDPERAKNGPFGRLAASGWHTAAMQMRLMVDSYISPAGLGSPGIDELRWHKPVFPGDRLRAQITVREARVSRSKPDRGLLRGYTEMFNQDGELVMTWKTLAMMRLRTPACGEPG